jgi:hypothetical protein
MSTLMLKHALPMVGLHILYVNLLMLKHVIFQKFKKKTCPLNDVEILPKPYLDLKA